MDITGTANLVQHHVNVIPAAR